ncbi:MAG: energy-coupling factor ABC transporter ATP-binding protein [Actinobacteria bacterium]|nr:energy-coupling factor ABC transporter ATP-binding protein [Actinomycetota bacterium]
MNEMLKLTDVEHAYAGGITALSRINLAIRPGEHVSIIGANGSGKSTLLKMMNGLVFPSSGEVTAYERRLTEEALEEPAFRREFRSRVGFVFQDADVQLFCPSVFDELTFGPLQLEIPAVEIERRVGDVARALRIDGLLARAPYGLSGGEKKRVAIASVLTIEPEVLLLDEPTNALDPRSQVWLLNLLFELKREGKTVVAATHDLSIVEDFADRVVVLSEAHEVVADGPTREVLADRELLLSVNLIHEHAHRHGEVIHMHEHGHATGLDHGHK